MIVNIKLELSDWERQQLGRFITGKPGKRLATRAQVRELVQEHIKAIIFAVEVAPKPAPSGFFPGLGQVTPAEEAEIAKLREAGHPDSYIVGCIKVDRLR